MCACYLRKIWKKVSTQKKYLEKNQTFCLNSKIMVNLKNQTIFYNKWHIKGEFE